MNIKKLFIRKSTGEVITEDGMDVLEKFQLSQEEKEQSKIDFDPQDYVLDQNKDKNQIETHLEGIDSEFQNHQGQIDTLASSMGSSTLEALTDTFINNPQDGHFLLYDNGHWEHRELEFDDIPNLTTSRITSGVFDPARIPADPQVAINTANITSLQTGVSALSLGNLTNVNLTGNDPGKFLKYDGTNWVNVSLVSSDIPSLDASKITSGVFSVNRIPTLPASSITSGVLGIARIPDLDASKITTGVLNLNRIPTIPNSKISGLGTMSTQNHTAVNIDGGDIAGISRLRVDSGTDTSELSILHSYNRGFAFNLTGNTNKLVSYSDSTNATRTVFSTGRRGTASGPTNGSLGYDFQVLGNDRFTINNDVITATKSIRSMQPAGTNVEVASFRRGLDMFHYYIDGTNNHFISYSDTTHGKVLRIESRCNSNAVPTNNTLGIDFRVNAQEFMRMRLNENNVTISKDLNVVGVSTNFNVNNTEVGLRQHTVLYNGAFIYMEPGKLGISQGSNWLRLNNSGHYTNGIYCGNSVVRTDNQLQVGANGNNFRAHHTILYANVTSHVEFKTSGNRRLYIPASGMIEITDDLNLNVDHPYLALKGKAAISCSGDGSDGWLRLNQYSQFSIGTYSPKLIRSEERLIAGNESNQYVRADKTQLVCNTTRQALLMSQTNSSNIIHGGGTTGQLEIRANTKTGGAYMATISFYRPAAFGMHLGIDETYNGLKVGGWSYGTNSYRVWTEHNLQWPVAWSSGIGRWINFSGGNGHGLNFWGTGSYSIYMSATSNGTYGGSIDPTGDYNMYFKMTTNTRGFCFKQGAAPGGIAAQITGNGNFYNTGQLLSPHYNLAWTSSSAAETYNLDPNRRFAQMGFYGGGTKTISVNGAANKPKKSAGPYYITVRNLGSSSVTITFNSTYFAGGAAMTINGGRNAVVHLMYQEALGKYYIVNQKWNVVP